MSHVKMHTGGCSEMRCVCGTRVVLSKRRFRAIPISKGYSPQTKWITSSTHTGYWQTWIGFSKGSLNHESDCHRNLEANGSRSTGYDNPSQPRIVGPHRYHGRASGKDFSPATKRWQPRASGTSRKRSFDESGHRGIP